MSEHLTIGEFLQAVEIVDAHLDSSGSPEYLTQPLARRWTRVTKVCEEAGEVWAALSKLTGENPRKGVCGTEAELLGELGDTASAAICAIQHLTKDTDATWAVISAALTKARRRVAELAEPETVPDIPVPPEVAAWLKDAPARRNDELHPDSRSAIAARLAAAARTAERERILALVDAWTCPCGEDDCSYYETRDQIATLIGDPDA